MSTLNRGRYESAANWPSSPEIDGYTWEPGPDPEDSQWLAEQNTTWDADDPVPDEVLDQQAEEARVQDLLDRGLLPY